MRSANPLVWRKRAAGTQNSACAEEGGVLAGRAERNPPAYEQG